MSEEKQPWPTPEKIVLMTTPEQSAMERYIRQWASGIGLAHKLRETYREGFKAGQNSEIAKGRKD